MWPAISAGEWRSSAITRDPELELRRRLARTPPASRARARPGGRSTTSSRSRARRSAPPAAPATSGSSPAATPNAALAHSSLEHRHALDVRRLREHVDRLHAAQRISGLDDLGGVRRQRRRVAGDVDDPRRLALEQPADDLRREAGARRVDDRRRRAGRRARAAAGSRAGRRRATKRALSIPFARRVVLGVGDRLGDALEAPDLARRARRARARSCRSRRRGRRAARCRSSPAKSPAIA